MMKHMSFIDIKKKSAYRLVCNEKGILDSFVGRSKEGSRKEQALKAMSSAVDSKVYSSSEIMSAVNEVADCNLVYHNFMFPYVDSFI